jgi:hypothetical protein
MRQNALSVALPINPLLSSRRTAASAIHNLFLTIFRSADLIAKRCKSYRKMLQLSALLPSNIGSADNPSKGIAEQR